MKAQTNRAYRKKIDTTGWMFLGGEVQKVSAKNISVSGVLVQLENKQKFLANKNLLQNLETSKSIDFFFPKLRLSGEAKVVRVESASDNKIVLAMQFANIANSMDRPIFKRKSPRKEMAIPGKLFLNDSLHKFVTQNMSLGGFMIRIPERLKIETNHIIQFELETIKLKGYAKIVWIKNPSSDQTELGLQFLKPHKKDDGKLH